MHGVLNALSCFKCTKKYNNTTQLPYLLQCYHTFCQECLERDIPAITCPLCSKVTSCASVASLPINYAIKDLVESSEANVQERTCDIHDNEHPATYWCFDCEQGLCDSAHLGHSKSKASKGHQTNKIGAEQPVAIRKPVLCSTHGRDLDLVCIHYSHPPQLACSLCVATSHQSHHCEDIAGYYKQKEGQIHTLLAEAKHFEGVLTKAMEELDRERSAVSQNKLFVENQIIAYFEKIIKDIDCHRRQLLEQLKTFAINKDEGLCKQKNSLLASVEGEKQVAIQLERTLTAKSPAKSLILMEQLHNTLQSFNGMEVRPREIAEMRFYAAEFTIPEVLLVDHKISEASVSTIDNEYPLVLATKVPLNRLEICACTHVSEYTLTTTKVNEGKYNIKPERGVPLGKHIVKVRWLGQHITGSPVTIYKWPSWSPNRKHAAIISNNILRSTMYGSWGMIQEQFSMLPQAFTIKVGNGYKYSISLYDSATANFPSGNDTYPGSLAYSVATTPQKWTLRREVNGKVSLLNDGNRLWCNAMPPCYVYVELLYEGATGVDLWYEGAAEIVLD